MHTARLILDDGQTMDIAVSNLSVESSAFCHTKVMMEGWIKSGELAKRRTMKVERVIFNDPATVVFWSDGSKTVVKCSENDTFDPEIGLAMAICKKAFGNTGAYNNVFKKWVNPE